MCKICVEWELGKLKPMEILRIIGEIKTARPDTHLQDLENKAVEAYVAELSKGVL